MNIENEIQQPKFNSEFHKLYINLLFTHNWMTNESKSFFSNLKITYQQFNILRILRGAHTEISTMQIRERMLDKMSDTSRLVDRLVIKGLVKKIVNKMDKRLVNVTITKKGLDLLKKGDLYEFELINIFKALTEKEAQQLNKLLDKSRGK
jgi:DNA-binding MarR family transcriptional regulator